MFPYDASLRAAVSTPVSTVADVLRVMQAIDSICIDGDGLKWFNWLYFRVTQQVEARIAAGGFTDSTWLATLDVQFAQLYFSAIRTGLSDAPTPGCWQALLTRRNQTKIARIQFAVAGVNAHINHDLPLALVATGTITNIAPRHLTPEYTDYTALNATFDSLIETAKTALHVRLLGDALPPFSRLEDTLGAWKVLVAREQAWTNAGILWALRGTPELGARFMETINGLTTVAGKTLLIPVP